MFAALRRAGGLMVAEPIRVSGARPPPAATKAKTSAQGSKAARYSSSIPLVGLAAPKARSDESKC